jgi:hypothetical protein
MEATMASLAISRVDDFPVVVSRLLDLFNEETAIPEAERQDPAPTIHALKTAFALINGAHREMPEFPRGAVSAHDAGIRINWATEGRSVRLISPATEEQPPYLYHEEIDNGRAKNFEIIGPATGAILYNWLKWLNEN